MKQKKETMAELLLSLESETRPLMTVFEDLVNILVNSITYGIDLDKTGRTLRERYQGANAERFKAAALQLQIEFDDRSEAGDCVDVLGEFYEDHLYGKGAGQRFLPWEVCQLVAAGVEQNNAGKHVEHATADPCCGSGRLLLAHIEHSGTERPLLGIDPDPLCAKMTAYNLFLKGAFMGEVMCANTAAKGADDFSFSYKFSLVPHGLIHITEREQSGLWMINRDFFSKHPLSSEVYNGRDINVSLIKFR